MARGLENIKNKISNIKNDTQIEDRPNDKKSGKVELKVRIKKVKKQKVAKVEKGAEASVKELKRGKFVGREIDQERMEKDKRLIMWSGIIFFIVLIIGFWLMNIKSILQINSFSQNKGSSSQINWNSFRDELNKTMTEIKQRLSEINQLQQTNQPSSSSQARPSLTPDQVNRLKNNLLENVIKEKATTTGKVKK